GGAVLHHVQPHHRVRVGGDDGEVVHVTRGGEEAAVAALHAAARRAERDGSGGGRRVVRLVAVRIGHHLDEDAVGREVVDLPSRVVLHQEEDVVVRPRVPEGEVQHRGRVRAVQVDPGGQAGPRHAVVRVEDVD